MSVRVMSLVWDSKVPSPERLVLLALADRADEDGHCWPSVGTLAAKCRMGASTIRRHLASLQKLGVLTIERRFNASSSYIISVPKLREMTALNEASSAPSEAAEGVRLTPSHIGTPSQSGTPPTSGPPPNLSTTPSQSGSLSIIDPSPTTADAVVGSARERATPATTPSPSPRRTSRSPAATRIPDDFRVTREMAEWAMTEFPTVDGRKETAAFIDYWKAKAGPNARKLDWVATWRNWIRRADEPAAGRSPARPRRSAADERIADLQRFRRNPPAPPAPRAIGAGT